MKKVKGLLVLLLIIFIGATKIVSAMEQNNTNRGLGVKYENINTSSTNGTVTIDDDNITFNTNLEVPGDYFEFTVDIVNNGKKEVKVNTLDITKLNSKQAKYLSFTVTYLDNENINVGDTIKANDKVTIKVRIEYNYDITAEDLPTEDETLNLTFEINYIEV